MVMKEADRELALFLEMRRKELEIQGNGIQIVPSSDKADAPPLGFNALSSPLSKTLSMDRKIVIDDFLNSENENKDLLWLLSPPGTPLTNSLKRNVHEHDPLTSQILNSCAQPAALKSSVENAQLDRASKKPVKSKNASLSCESKSSARSSKRSSLSGSLSSASRGAATPTGTGRSIVPAANNPPRSSTLSKVATKNPSRSSTPSRVADQPSCTKPVGPPSTRSSTPTRSSAHSSSPAPKSTLKQSLPSTRPSNWSNTKAAGAPEGQARSSSATKSRAAASKAADHPKGASPASEPRLGSSTVNKNLKTCVPRRPVSASKVRPSASISNKSFPPIKSRRPSTEDDEVNPVEMGTKMVERIVNMRKLAPPNTLEGSGFGRSLSKKSLDMAMRHMDIGGSISGKKLNRVRSVPTKSSRAGIVVDSSLATSSNASSDLSVSSSGNSTSIDGSETEDNDLRAAKVAPVVMQGR